MYLCMCLKKKEIFFSPYSCLPLIAVTFVQFVGLIDSNLSDCAEWQAIKDIPSSVHHPSKTPTRQWRLEKENDETLNLFMLTIKSEELLKRYTLKKKALHISFLNSKLDHLNPEQYAQTLCPCYKWSSKKQGEDRDS